MNGVRVLTLKESLEQCRDHLWFQMRWWSKAEPMVFTHEQMPWLIFREFAGDKRVRIQANGEEYGKSWRCFNAMPDGLEDKFPWDDGVGRWTVEEDPEE